ncbi:MAG: DUF3333 domain-containing protein, partial [Desulfobacterales bacterium]
MNKPNASAAKMPQSTIEIVNKSLGKRYRSERRFRLYGLVAIILSLAFLTILFTDIIRKGYSAFWQTYVEIDVFFDPTILREESLASA